MNTTLTKLAASMICSFCAAAVLAAQPDKPIPIPSASDVALYEGSDRQELLVREAKKEGQVSVYHTWATQDLQPVFAAFTQKYGIPVKPWRAGSEAVLQRTISEARAGRSEVDIVQLDAPESEALHREKLLQEVRSPYLKELLPQAIPDHKEWVGIGIDLFVAAYNTNLVKKEDLPKTYNDLLDPKWKGGLGMEADDSAWFGTLLEAMGEQQALKLFTEIASSNGVSLYKGHSAFTSMVVAGQVRIGLTNYDYMPKGLKEKGAPIESFVLEPLIAQVQAAAMLKQAPHPHAAVLFYDFMINEGQALLAKRGFLSTNTKINTSLEKMKFTLVNPARALDMSLKWRQTWEEVVLKSARNIPKQAP